MMQAHLEIMEHYNENRAFWFHNEKHTYFVLAPSGFDMLNLVIWLESWSTKIK